MPTHQYHSVLSRDWNSELVWMSDKMQIFELNKIHALSDYSQYLIPFMAASFCLEPTVVT